MALGKEVGFSPVDFVLHGDPPPPQNCKGGSHQFSVHVYCGQTAAWIKMPLGREVGFGPRDIVLDGHPAPLPKNGAAREPLHQFSTHLLWPNDWMDQDGTCQGVGHIVLDGDPARFMSLVAKRLDG